MEETKHPLDVEWEAWVALPKFSFRWNTPGEIHRVDEKPQHYVENPKEIGPRLSFEELFHKVCPLRMWRDHLEKDFPLLSEIAYGAKGENSRFIFLPF